MQVQIGRRSASLQTINIQSLKAQRGHEAATTTAHITTHGHIGYIRSSNYNKAKMVYNDEHNDFFLFFFSVNVAGLM